MIHQVIISDRMKQYVEAYVDRNDWKQSGSALPQSEKKRALYVGLIGELTVHYYLKGEYPTLVSGFDGGVDLIHNRIMFDVKTMQRNTFVKPEYVNNVYERQIGFPADGFIFCSFNAAASILEICGWIMKEELRLIAPLYLAGSQRLRDDGSAFTFNEDVREIEMKQLQAIDTLKGW